MSILVAPLPELTRKSNEPRVMTYDEKGLRFTDNITGVTEYFLSIYKLSAEGATLKAAMAVAPNARTFNHKHVYRLSIVDTGIAALSTRFSLRGPDQISDYVKGKKALVGLLIKAQQYIYRCFDDFPNLALEVVTDPEDGTKELLLIIQTADSARVALQALDKFDEGWWYDNIGKIQGLFTVKLEYI